jgi:hypothetical protein
MKLERVNQCPPAIYFTGDPVESRSVDELRKRPRRNIASKWASVPAVS